MSGPCCQRCHVAQSTALQGQIGPLGELQLSVLRLVPSGVIGLTEEPKSGFPKSFQAPPVVVSTPHCRQKEKRLGPLRLSRAILYGLISTGGLQRILLRNVRSGRIPDASIETQQGRSEPAIGLADYDGRHWSRRSDPADTSLAGVCSSSGLWSYNL